ncbi:MAG: PfkB family carbohydrate kinase [Candidatus Thiodiazotropha sp.]
MRVLAVGTATLDIVNRVPVYPREDQELRATAQQIRHGGNAANTLEVLSHLGHQTFWAGCLASDSSSQQIRSGFHGAGIDERWARVHPGCVTPTSYILSSEATGSRSIVHYRDLPEFEYEDFLTIDLSGFDWLHFEGRNPPATECMLARAREVRPDAIRSLELEKPRPGLERCLADADVVMLSRVYALSQGCLSAQSLFERVRSMAPQALLFLAWGDSGGWCQTADGVIVHRPAYRPPRVVDTLGAGDVFNAGLIHRLRLDWDATAALAFAVRLAGEKCAHTGLV